MQVCCDYHSVLCLSFDAYIRACVRARKTKNRVYFQMCDAVECRKIAFEALFSPAERVLWFFPYKLPQMKRKRLKTP